MEYVVTITEEAEKHLDYLSARDQKTVTAAIGKRLVNQPDKTTRAIKKLRPNPFAQFELRIGNFRVLYNVDEAEGEVTILLVGKKQGNKLVVEGEEFHGHESDPAK